MSVPNAHMISFLAMRSSLVYCKATPRSLRSRGTSIIARRRALVLPAGIRPVAAAGAAGEIVHVGNVPAGDDRVARDHRIGEVLGVRQIDDEVLRAGALDRHFDPGSLVLDRPHC